MFTNDQIDSLTDKSGNVVTPDGEKIGGIGHFYLDDETGEANWLTVKTGLFGTHESFVPLDEARLQDDDLVVPYSKDQVKDAPHIDPDNRLEQDEEDRLYDYYRGLGWTGRGPDAGERPITDAATTATGYAATGGGGSGYEAAAAQRQEMGRRETEGSRLRRYVRTETRPDEARAETRPD